MLRDFVQTNWMSCGVGFPSQAQAAAGSTEPALTVRLAAILLLLLLVRGPAADADGGAAAACCLDTTFLLLAACGHRKHRSQQAGNALL
jgi:hypothetical protein